MNTSISSVIKISVGEVLPSFSLPNQNGVDITSQDLKGTKYIMFFYPQDDSPSCTKEACSLRDHFRDFTKKGYKIFGVSPDSPKKHKKFIEKYEFQYDLLSDENLEVLHKFGLYGPKKFMGKDIIGVYRTTLVVDENGVLNHIIDDVKTAKHGEQILSLIK